MNRRVIRADIADRDLAQIWSYVARDNPAAADRLIQSIERAIQSLAAEPELGTRMDHIAPGLYCKPVRKNYLIFYTVQDKQLFIVRALHGARAYDQLF